jgi:hypothetical protein
MASRKVLAHAVGALAFALGLAAAAPARATLFTFDLGAACVSMTVSGRAIVCNDGTRIALDASITPSCPQWALARSGANYTLVCAVPNATGLWWRADEDGRGTWLSHQGDTIFAVDYAYDAADLPRWRTLIAVKRDDGMFMGDVFETHGPSFSAATFDAQSVTNNKIGTGWIAQDDSEHVRVNMAEGVARALTRQRFGALPSCSFGQIADTTTAANYTDLWWNPAESGWGINLTHQGDTIFAAWYTYGTDGTALFLVASLLKTAAGTYTGDLYRATGPVGAIHASAVGTATLDFTNGNSATFTTAAQLPGMSAAMTRVKPLTRQIFAEPGSACQ